MGRFSDYRRRLKIRWRRSRIADPEFSIISNNCWSTRIYQQFGLPYLSPLANLFIFAPDYIRLLEDFSLEALHIESFIPHQESRYKVELMDKELYDTGYPIGILKDDIEVHFQHYSTEEDARDKWERRIERIIPDRLMFKFSDGYLATDEHIERFDALPFRNKVCFTAKPYPHLKSVVYMERFREQGHTELEWNHWQRYFDLYSFINQLGTDSDGEEAV